MDFIKEYFRFPKGMYSCNNVLVTTVVNFYLEKTLKMRPKRPFFLKWAWFQISVTIHYTISDNKTDLIADLDNHKYIIINSLHMKNANRFNHENAIYLVANRIHYISFVYDGINYSNHLKIDSNDCINEVNC